MNISNSVLEKAIDNAYKIGFSNGCEYGRNECIEAIKHFIEEYVSTCSGVINESTNNK